MNDEPDRSELFELYRIAIEEYRFAVGQNADRQKFFVGLNVAVSSVVPTLFAQSADPNHYRNLLTGVLLVAALTALIGLLAVERSHENYRNARRQFQLIEERLGLRAAGLGLATTEGMRSDMDPASMMNASAGVKVYRAVQFLLGVLLVFDLLAAWWVFDGR